MASPGVVLVWVMISRQVVLISLLGVVPKIGNNRSPQISKVIVLLRHMVEVTQVMVQVVQVEMPGPVISRVVINNLKTIPVTRPTTKANMLNNRVECTHGLPQ